MASRHMRLCSGVSICLSKSRIGTCGAKIAPRFPNRKNIDAGNSKSRRVRRMSVNNRGHIRPRFHDFEVHNLLIDRLNPAFQPIAVDVTVTMSLTLVSINERPSEWICPRINTLSVPGMRALTCPFVIGQILAGGENAVRPGKPSPQTQNFRFQRRLRVGVGGAVEGHLFVSRKS